MLIFWFYNLHVKLDQRMKNCEWKQGYPDFICFDINKGAIFAE